MRKRCDAAGVSEDAGRRDNEKMGGIRFASCQLNPQIPTRDKGTIGLVLGDDIQETAQGIRTVEDTSMKLLAVRASVIRDRE